MIAYLLQKTTNFNFSCFLLPRKEDTMSKECKDFIYRNQRLSDLGFIASVSFEGSDDLPLGLSREIEKSETNKYRKSANQTGIKYSEDNLSFEIDIMKDPCQYHTQDDLEFTDKDVRKITRWLSSPQFYLPLKCEYASSSQRNSLTYYGIFTNIEKWVIANKTYGLKLTFSCSTPFAYTDDIICTVQAEGNKTLVINNEDDELDDYVYPILNINAAQTGDIFICNLSDCTLLNEGSLYPSTVPSGLPIDILQQKISDYALTKGYETVYQYESDGTTVKTFCDKTAVQFTYKNSQDTEFKCFAFYLDDGKYKIIRNGMLHLTVNKSLPINIDFQQLRLFDDLGRPVYFSSLGVEDVDQVYWLRLLNGDNNLLFYGKNCTFTLKYRECRKVGA